MQHCCKEGKPFPLSIVGLQEPQWFYSNLHCLWSAAQLSRWAAQWSRLESGMSPGTGSTFCSLVMKPNYSPVSFDMQSTSLGIWSSTNSCCVYSPLPVVTQLGGINHLFFHELPIFGCWNVSDWFIVPPTYIFPYSHCWILLWKPVIQLQFILVM